MLIANPVLTLSFAASCYLEAERSMSPDRGVLPQKGGKKEMLMRAEIWENKGNELWRIVKRTACPIVTCL
jgi:hypothetical protein